MCTTWLTCLLPERGDKCVWLLILPASDVLLIHLDLLFACLIITCRAHEQVSKRSACLLGTTASLPGGWRLLAAGPPSGGKHKGNYDGMGANLGFKTGGAAVMRRHTDAVPQSKASQTVIVLLGGTAATSNTEQGRLPKQCWAPANLYCWALSTSMGGSNTERACLADHPRDLGLPACWVLLSAGNLLIVFMAPNEVASTLPSRAGHR